MKLHLLLLPAALFAFNVRAGVLQDTQSPDKKLAIAEIGRDYYFVDVENHRRLGSVIPSQQRGHITNVRIEDVSWNKGSNAVALALYYGTKVGGVLLYERGANGEFEPLVCNCPDPFEE